MEKISTWTIIFLLVVALLLAVSYTDRRASNFGGEQVTFGKYSTDYPKGGDKFGGEEVGFAVDKDRDPFGGENVGPEFTGRAISNIPATNSWLSLILILGLFTGILAVLQRH